MSSVTDAMMAPAEPASSLTKVIVAPWKRSSASMISTVTPASPPGVFMSSTTRSAFCSIASFSPRRRM